MMIEALARHDCWQREARDCQEYQWQLDSTDLPGATFLPPRTMDWDVTTELDPTLLEGVEGAMASPGTLEFHYGTRAVRIYGTRTREEENNPG